MKREIEGILNIIKRIELEYQQTQGLILSEDDLKCLVYKYLYELYSLPMKTIDTDVKAIRLHTEIPWYDNNGNLSIYPDITIVSNLTNLSIKHKLSFSVKDGMIYYDKLPRKEFSFGGDAILMELKFIKKKSGANQTDSKRIERDINKMLALIEKHCREIITGVMVIFNKTNKGREFVESLIYKYKDFKNLRIMYCTGNVNF